METDTNIELESDLEFFSTPPEITMIAQNTSADLLPDKSKKRYNHTYQNFMAWRAEHKVNSFSENVILAYFTELSEKFKASTLWAQYSMLKSTINLNNNINIEQYTKLISF